MVLLEKDHFLRARRKKKIYTALIVLSLCAILIAAVYYASKLASPSKAKTPDYKLSAMGREVDSSKLFIESDELVLRFNQKEDSGNLMPDDMLLLSEALEKAELAFKTTKNKKPERYRMLRDLRARYQNQAVAPLLEETRRLEREARNLIDSEDYAEAEELLKMAVEVQKEINSDYSSSLAVDHTRSSSLEDLIRDLAVRPQLRESMDQTRLARDLESKGEWKKALIAWERALEIQKSINEQNRGKSVDDQPRARELKHTIEAYVGLDMYMASRDQEEVAEAALEAKDYESAVLAYTEAAHLQREINEKHAGGRFASAVRAHDLVEKAFNTEALPDFRRLKTRLGALRAALHQRNRSLAKASLSGLADEVRAFLSKYPKSSYFTSEEVTRIRYIEAMLPQIELIWNRVDEGILSIGAGMSLYAYPVDKGFFELLAGRLNGKEESEDGYVRVNSSEASRFVTRLGFLLGQRVKLPTPDNLSAFASGRTSGVPKNQWALSDSGTPIIVYKELDTSDVWRFRSKIALSGQMESNTVFHFAVLAE